MGITHKIIGVNRKTIAFEENMMLECILLKRHERKIITMAMHIYFFIKKLIHITQNKSL